MSTIICGNNQAYHSCDAVGCTETSEKIYYNDNVIEIDEKIREEKWYISFSDDKSYCPKHSPYNQYK
jgi:hypothetical protein